jgi:predicted metal-dependent phosphoesterase TrpH
MAQPAADLHVHTTASDGTLPIEAVPAAADAADIDLVAVTDHDRIHPELDAPITDHNGVTVIRGIELRVDTDRQRLDLLGYGVRSTDALTTELDRLQQDRIERAQQIIDCVETRLGVALDLDPQPGIGRPHIARAIADSDADNDFQGAFDELIGNGCPCYVPREITPVDRGINLLTEACPVVGLAHPLRYDDPSAALDHAAELDAVERYYPYDHAVDPDLVDDAIDRHSLLATGGSDAHETTLGHAGPPPAAVEAFRRRLEKR